MNKFFGFFAKRKRKERSFCSISFDLLPVEVYRNYDFDSESRVIRSGDTFVFDFNSKLKNDLNQFEESSVCQLVYSDLNNTSLDVKTSNAQKISSEKVDKSGKNICVINIRNCKYFNVGPQKTVNVTRSGVGIEKVWSLLVDLNFLLDCNEKISEENIMVISLHMGNNWKKFGTSLEFKEKYLEELKSRTDDNTIFMTLDILQKYMGLFPNTSVGFIVSILNEIQQVKIIRELAKNIKA